MTYKIKCLSFTQHQKNPTINSITLNGHISFSGRDTNDELVQLVSDEINQQAYFKPDDEPNTKQQLQTIHEQPANDTDNGRDDKAINKILTNCKLNFFLYFK